MINGNVAKTTNISVSILVAISLIGVVILAAMSKEVPAELAMSITAGLGFLAGTKFTPLGGYTQKEVRDVNPDDTVTVKESKG